MKKIYILLLIIPAFIFHLPSSFAQNSWVKQWDKRFGGNSFDVFITFQQTGDGGYILGGYSYSDSSGDKTQASRGDYDYWVVKTDSFGNKQWDKDFGGTGTENLSVVLQTNDGGYLIGGYSVSGAGGDKTQPLWGNYDYWIVKTDSQGNKEWDKDYGGTGYDRLEAVLQTKDGGYLLGGYSFSGMGGDKTDTSKGSYDIWLVKINSKGALQWNKVIGGTNADYLYDMLQTADGGYILGGKSSSGVGADKTQATKGYNDYWMVKTDSLGNIQWDQDYGGTGDDLLFTIIQTKDRGYLLGGYAESPKGGDKSEASHGLSDYWIVKTDSLGHKQWDKAFGGTYRDEFYRVIETADSGYLLSGNSYSSISGDKSENNLGPEQTWIIKTDVKGNKQWDKTILAPGYSGLGCIVQSGYGCYTIASYNDGDTGAYKTQASQGHDDYWLIKFCDSTVVTALPLYGLKEDVINVSPNPAGDKIRLNGMGFVFSHIEIYNVLGQVCSQSEIILPAVYLTNGVYSESHIDVDVSGLSPGLYFLQLKGEKGTVVKRFVKD